MTNEKLDIITAMDQYENKELGYTPIEKGAPEEKVPVEVISPRRESITAVRVGSAWFADEHSSPLPWTPIKWRPVQ